jgi:hypothetical protein
MSKNKIIVNMFLEDGCKQEDGEVNTSWHPINFSIYDDLFFDLIKEAIEQWLSEHKLAVYQLNEVIFHHVVEHDGAGACMGEYFEPIHHEITLM